MGRTLDEVLWALPQDRREAIEARVEGLITEIEAARSVLPPQDQTGNSLNDSLS